MTRTHRVRRSYGHRLRDAIAATGNADLFRDVAMPASTRRTWARGEVRPVVAVVDVELEVYELLEQVDNQRQRGKVQAAHRFGYHAWRRKEYGCGLDDVREHNEEIPRAVLGSRTPDEVYFGREESLLERLSEQQKKAQEARSTANRRASCQLCQSSGVGAAAPNVARPKLVENLLVHLHKVCVSRTAGCPWKFRPVGLTPVRYRAIESLPRQSDVRLDPRRRP